MANNLSVISATDALLPVQVVAGGDKAARRFIEFFTANIRNPNTRAAYARSVSDFFRWCERLGIGRLEAVDRRAKAAGIRTKIGCHTFRATGITIYLTNGGDLEKASKWQRMRARGQPSSMIGVQTS